MQRKQSGIGGRNETLSNAHGCISDAIARKLSTQKTSTSRTHYRQVICEATLEFAQRHEHEDRMIENFDLLVIRQPVQATVGLDRL